MADTAVAAQPESDRLDDDAYVQGLIDLELIDLLERYLDTTPIDDEAEVARIRREIALLKAGDESRSEQERQAALREANGLLSQLIDERTDRTEQLDLELKLARSLIYQQAEPYYSSIFYQGGTAADHTTLSELMDQATQILARVQQWLDEEFQRLDSLSLQEYERLDKGGHVEHLERAIPQVDYMLRWARFYKGLALPKDDSEARRLFEEVRTELVDHTTLLETPHRETHLQAQSLLLAGLTSRRLGDWESAARYLQDAVAVVESIPDRDERQDLQWLSRLAAIEQIRALRDGEEFDAAEAALDRVRNRFTNESPDNFGLRLVTALLETSLQQARADWHRRQGESRRAEIIEARAMNSLQELANTTPEHRDAVYSTLYTRLMDRNIRAPKHLFEKCALIAGHIMAARELRRQSVAEDGQPSGIQAGREAMRLLDDAIALARALLEEENSLPRNLRCEAWFNLGAAQYHRGDRLEAAVTLVDCAADCTDFDRAVDAAEYAVQIASELFEEPGLRNRPEVRAIYQRALQVLLDDYPDSQPASYWRFFLAQLKEEDGDNVGAARLYAMVGPDHPYAPLAQLRALRARMNTLKQEVDGNAIGAADARRLAENIKADVEQLRNTLSSSEGTDANNADWSSIAAEAVVLEAEVALFADPDRPEQVISLLEGFSDRHPDRRDLLGRVLLTRIIAYQRAGNLEAARQVAPSFLKSDPQQAASALQALLDEAWADYRIAKDAGRSAEAERASSLAVMLAEELYRWGRSREDELDDATRRVLTLQLAEARLESGRLDEAIGLYHALVGVKPWEALKKPGTDARTLLGLMDAYYRNKDYQETLLLANGLYNALPVGSQERFRALLRDLQARKNMGESKEALRDIIRQHRFMTPEMGGPELQAQFDELEREISAK